MIRITQLKLSINHTPEELSQKIRKELRLKNEGFTYEIVKQSLDCRHKEDKKFVYTVDVSLQDINQENKILRKVHDNNIMSTKKKEYIFPSPGEEELKYPPVIVGIKRREDVYIYFNDIILITMFFIGFCFSDFERFK